MTPYLVAACALLGAFGIWQWNARANEAARADRAEQALQTESRNEKVVTKYVDRKVEIIRRVPVIRDRLVAGVCHDAGVPGAADPDAAASAEAGHGIADALAGEIGACLAETEQLKSLHEVLRPQIGAQ